MSENILHQKHTGVVLVSKLLKWALQIVGVVTSAMPPPQLHPAPTLAMLHLCRRMTSHVPSHVAIYIYRRKVDLHTYTLTIAMPPKLPLAMSTNACRLQLVELTTPILSFVTTTRKTLTKIRDVCTFTTICYTIIGQSAFWLLVMDKSIISPWIRTQLNRLLFNVT